MARDYSVYHPNRGDSATGRDCWQDLRASLPEGKPFIVSDRERYDLGDTLRANCSLPASRPTARLSFALNNIPVRNTV
ncbi:platelet endothelial cell adhesion molecule-like [Vespula maculifrons]|uniref:Platelet endothelial cell adhesion molecule-like n=1 Tax=Vespula maculifrons TaxID=7453 RepID=A0ABD2D3L0_VESMC